MSQLLFSSHAINSTGICYASLAATTVVQYLILAGAILLVAGIVMAWAVFFRKKPRTRRYRYQRAQPTPGTTPTAESNKRERRRRRAEPRRNPTLAETRGLPPIRSEDSDATEHYQH